LCSRPAKNETLSASQPTRGAGPRCDRCAPRCRGVNGRRDFAKLCSSVTAEEKTLPSESARDPERSSIAGYEYNRHRTSSSANMTTMQATAKKKWDHGGVGRGGKTLPPAEGTT